MWTLRGAAVVVVGALLTSAPAVTPALSRASAAPGARAHPVAGSTHAVALGAAPVVSAAAVGTPDATGPDVAAPSAVAAASAGAAPVTTRRVRLGKGSMVGVTFASGTRVGPGQDVQVRVQRRNGSWGPWNALALDDNAPDADTAEARQAHGGTTASDPLWVGPGSTRRQVEVQLPSTEVAGAALSVVDPGTSAADAVVSADEQPGAAEQTSADEQPGAVREASVGAAAGTAVGMPVIHTRAQWGADESLRRCGPQYSTTVRAAVLHHTADPDDDYTAAQVPAMIRATYRYHVVTRGWCDIAYNVLVDRFGGIWEGRAGGLDQAVLGAHVGGFNNQTFGVAMIGDYETVRPSAAMLESVAEVMAWKLGGYYRDPLGTVTLTSTGGAGTTDKYADGTRVTLPVIFGHRQVGATECPGDAGYAELPWIRQRVAQIIAAAPASAVAGAWQRLGGAAGPLGEPADVEMPTPDGRGRYNHFAHGSVYWTPATGAHEVLGAIQGEWAGMGWERSVLGYPTSDELTAPDGVGRFSVFQGGSVYWTPATGAHEVQGLVRAEWAATGYERGVLGYPTADERATPDGLGRYSAFQHGSVYWTPATGAHEVDGPVLGEWAALGWERSVLGYPTSDVTATPDGLGRQATFQRGSVYWSAMTGAHEVQGAIRNAWTALGAQASALGYPTDDEHAAADGSGARVSDFQGGTITWTAATGPVVTLATQPS